ncbi:hypothetical protein K8T06_12505 [bacterium]|nr:hypothetical protein [bacterium]
MKQTQVLRVLRHAFFVTVLIGANASAGTLWVCQDCEPYMEPNFTTVSKAIETAEPGDKITILAEEFPPGSAEIIKYSEHIILNKSLTLTCDSINPLFGYPIITVDNFSEISEIILITEKAKGSKISNLHIRGPLTNNTDCQGKPTDHITEKVGIRIKTKNYKVDTCKITHCMTGILIDSTVDKADSGTGISNCIIGEPWIGIVDSNWCKEDAWTESHRGHPIHHPGNKFGIMFIKPGRKNSSNISPSEQIKDCKIQSNRYGGVAGISVQPSFQSEH